MTLSPTLLCLETNSLLKLELFDMKNSVTNTPAERKINSEYFSLKENLKNPNEFFEYLRITRRVFEYIFEKTEDELHAQVMTVKTISAQEKLFMTIRYLVTGMSIREISHVFCIGRSTACKIIGTTLKTIWKKMSYIHLRRPTPREMHYLANNFYEKWKFPSCVAAIGGKYVMLVKKKKYASLKKKAKLSVVLSVAADANSRLVCVDVSDLADDQECLFTDIFAKCGSQKLPGTDAKVPLVIVANSGFPLKNHIMRPFPGRNLSQDKQHYNDMVKKGSVSVNIAFEILTQKFKILSNAVCINEQHAKLAIRVCCLLYNIAKDIDEDNDSDFLKAREYGPDFSHLSMMKISQKRNRSPAFAMALRLKFLDYFMCVQPKLMEIDCIQDQDMKQ